MTSQQIAQAIPCSVRTVYKWIEMWQERGEDGLSDRKNNRAPRKTTPEQDAAIVQTMNNSPFETINNTIAALELQESRTTLQCRLHTAGLHYRRAAKRCNFLPSTGNFE